MTLYLLIALGVWLGLAFDAYMDRYKLDYRAFLIALFWPLIVLLLLTVVGLALYIVSAMVWNSVTNRGGKI